MDKIKIEETKLYKWVMEVAVTNKEIEYVEQITQTTYKEV